MAQQQLVDKRDQFVRTLWDRADTLRRGEFDTRRAPRDDKGVGKNSSARATSKIGNAVPPSEERRLGNDQSA